jgi:catechol 2,3-dioxygenase-like lactoylglutathione lyase family enzyme
MAKLRHIALSVPDPWASAEFYMRAFGLRKVGEADTPVALGVYLTDGTINLALLKYKTEELAGPLGKDFVGIHHFGFWVDDVAAGCSAAEAAGATHFAGEPKADNTFYEVKYRDPVDGLIFDITAHGWVGASRDGVSPTDGPKLSKEDLRADRSFIDQGRSRSAT